MRTWRVECSATLTVAMLASAAACAVDETPNAAAPLLPCPTATVQPDGGSTIRDYLDIVRLGESDYIAEAFVLGAATPDKQPRRSDLGSVITTVRCSALTQPNESVVDLIDRSATKLTVGTTLHSVNGYSSTCRVAAFVNGKVRIYRATDPSSSIAAPLPCASAAAATP